jgi:hypothetical protein
VLQLALLVVGRVAGCVAFAFVDELESLCEAAGGAAAALPIVRTTSLTARSARSPEVSVALGWISAEMMMDVDGEDESPAGPPPGGTTVAMIP